jgi:hypothetical protein
MGPVVGGRLPRRGDHGRDQEKQFRRHPVADERGGEAAERLRDDDQIGPVADRAGHCARVLGQAGRVVVTWKIRRDGVMASCTQSGLHQMPVPADIASAVDQDECGHSAPFLRSRSGPPLPSAPGINRERDALPVSW